MAFTVQGESLLLAQFRQFYSEVIRLKRQVKHGVWTAAPPMPEEDDAEEASTAQSIHSVWQRLLNLLQKQEAEASRLTKDYLYDVYKEAQFIMAALADDIFLNLDWTGKPVWEDNLLEGKLFNTHSAGDSFFEKLDRLLANRDTYYAELAKVYLLALSLGFEGKYRGKESEELSLYRRQLFNFIKQREPLPETDQYRIFPQSYDHTLDQAKEKRLPHPRGWIAAVFVMVFALGLASHGLWVHHTADLKFILNQVFSIR